MAPNRVFIVDDEEANLAFLSAILTDAGCAVEAASDGQAALARMEADPPDLALLDVQMPGMNGFQLLRAMRDRPALAAVPVAFLSAIGAVTGEDYDPESIEQRYGVRPDAFVPKPIDPPRVQDVLDQFLSSDG